MITDALFLNGLLGDAKTQNQSDIRDAIVTYFTAKKINDVEEKLEDRIFGPSYYPPMQDTQDLDRAENSPSYGSHILTALGLNAESALKSSTRKPPGVTRDFSELEDALARFTERANTRAASRGLQPILKEAEYGGRVIGRTGRGGAALRRAIGSL